MVILLDIDGVLVIRKAGRNVEIAPDGFMLFKPKAVKNLARLIAETNADVILTTTHRVSFWLDEWREIFKKRGLNVNIISKVNEIDSVFKIMDRATEIKDWVDTFGANTNYVVIDDDHSIDRLPQYIKDRCVLTNSAKGFDEAAYKKALSILLNNTDI